MGILRIVKMDFQSSMVQEFDEFFDHVEPKILEQPGCLKVMLLKSTANPLERTTLSWWEDEASLLSYRSSALFGEVWPRTKAKFQNAPIAWSLEWDLEGMTL